MKSIASELTGDLNQKLHRYLLYLGDEPITFLWSDITDCESI